MLELPGALFNPIPKKQKKTPRKNLLYFSKKSVFLYFGITAYQAVK